MGSFRFADPGMLTAAALLLFATMGSAQTPQLPVIPPPVQPAQGQQSPPVVVPDPSASSPYPNIPQNGATPSTPERPLTPEEQRQLEIQKYDPLNTSNPARKVVPGDRQAPQGLTGNNAPAQQNNNSQAAPQNQDNAPLPGSVAESNQNQTTRANPQSEGPQVATGNDTDLNQQSYTGPAVLSRSYTIARPMESKEVKWSWTAGSTETWQSGIVTQNASGVQSANGHSFGSGATFSFQGRHFWKRDQIGVQYNAAYNRYFEATNYNGANQNLSLDYQHLFSRHLALNVVETGVIQSQNYSFENPLSTPGVSAANVNLAASPSVQVFDQRIRQSVTSVGLTWQKTARLSFNINSTFFAVSYTGTQLASSVGYSEQADVNYRLTRKTTVGAYYSYNDYTFFKHESVSNSNTVGLIYSYALNRTSQLRLRGGVAALENLTLTEIPLAPVLVELTGTQFGVADIYTRHYTTDLSGQFIKDFGRKRTGNVSFARGIAPGNGLILTSIQETIAASFSTFLFRRYTLTINGGRSTLTSEAQNSLNYRSDFVGINLYHSMRRGPSANFGVSYSRIAETGYSGIAGQLRVSTGLTWGPGPGRLW